MGWIPLVLLLLVLVVAGTILVQYFLQGTAIQRIRPLGSEDGRLQAAHPLFRETFGLLTDSELHPDNRVDLLLNGEQLFPRLWADLAAARSTITFQVFWLRPGRLADRLGEVLTERARAGVSVLALFDYFGYGQDDAYRRTLEEAGVEVAMYRPLRWRNLYKFQQRSHIRSVVIDGAIGYTGGFGIDDRWDGDGRHPGQWRDTHVRIEGPSVDELRAAFVVNWAEATGDLIVGDLVFSAREGGAGNVERSGIVYCAPDLGSTTAERAFTVAIAGARDRLWITNAYFVPDDSFVHLLAEAVGRGVDVRVLTPGENNDRASAQYAGRARYEELLAAGVRIWEYRPTMVHAKTMVVDGAWSMVGTINFDPRSMSLNEEVELVVQDRAFARRMEEVFLRDLELADEVDLEAFRRRPWTDHVKERAAQLVAPLL